MSKLLLLEDDLSLIDGLTYSLNKAGYQVDVARTVGEALERLRKPDCFALLLLDVTLPDGTGFSVCEQVRERGSTVPIIFLTASDEEVNVIRGLDSGGDDYITKPFKLGELLSRIRALLRRAGISTAQPANQMQCGDLTIDLLSGRAAMCGHPLELTQAEFRLLCLLVRNAGRVVTREVILNDLWDNAGDFVDDNTLSVYVRRLREKVEKLEKAAAQRDADEAVTQALKAGKITPAQKKWAVSYALSDPKGFADFAAKAPQVVPMDQIIPDGPDTPAGGIDEVTRLVCKQLGINEEDVKKYGMKEEA